jgi:hypothetical protein
MMCYLLRLQIVKNESALLFEIVVFFEVYYYYFGLLSVGLIECIQKHIGC